MDARLDPECRGALDLERRHREQTTLLLDGGEGQLAEVVRATQAKQVREHLVACARCRHYDPTCPSCGFDLRERHGWRCPAQGTRLSEWLPWNWRARHAPPRPRGWDAAAPGAVRRAPPPATSPRAAAAPKPPARAPTPAAKPSPSPLAAAYAALGLTSAATPEQVRRAFRERAKEYHPDRVATLAPEFREVAERRMKEINAAYERIRKAQAPA